MQPLGEDGEKLCAFCARPATGRITSLVGLASWESITGEARTWLPFCEDNSGCAFRLGVVTGMAMRVQSLQKEIERMRGLLAKLRGGL